MFTISECNPMITNILQNIKSFFQLGEIELTYRKDNINEYFLSKFFTFKIYCNDSNLDLLIIPKRIDSAY